MARLSRAQLDLLAWVAITGRLRSGSHLDTQLAIMNLYATRGEPDLGRWYELVPGAPDWRTLSGLGRAATLLEAAGFRREDWPRGQRRCHRRRSKRKLLYVRMDGGHRREIHLEYDGTAWGYTTAPADGEADRSGWERLPTRSRWDYGSEPSSICKLWRVGATVPARWAAPSGCPACRDADCPGDCHDNADDPDHGVDPRS